MKKLAITIGDPSGVGPEIILKWANENPQLAKNCEVIGNAQLLDLLPSYIGKREISSEVFALGSPCKNGAILAHNALEEAAYGCKNGEYCAVVTAPVSKAEMVNAGYNFVGQTEFFESKWSGRAVMCFAGEKILLALATWHIPLSAVSKALSFDKIERATNCLNEMCKALREKQTPKIAVCGLNPHAGENGILGSEEIEIINPALNELRKKYPNISSALPPDTVFMRALKGEFDGIVSMYHDQGLAPLKALEFDSAVNVSMGLEFVRTSPDHGTGFDIAGKNIASCKSFAAAVNVAFKLVTRK